VVGIVYFDTAVMNYCIPVTYLV